MYKYLSKNIGTILEITLIVIFLITLVPVLEKEKMADIKNEKLNTKFSYNYLNVSEKEQTNNQESNSEPKIIHEFVTPTIINEPIVKPQQEEKPKVEESETLPMVETSYPVIETYVGALTGYGPDCVGCVSGETSTGHNAYELYYNDETYGQVRVIAADPSFPDYSVFKISNVPNMDSFLAIVLDRGSNVGFNRGTLFDLLYPSEAEALHKTNNVTFELIRKGK